MRPPDFPLKPTIANHRPFMTGIKGHFTLELEGMKTLRNPTSINLTWWGCILPIFEFVPYKYVAVPQDGPHLDCTKIESHQLQHWSSLSP